MKIYFSCYTLWIRLRVFRNMFLISESGLLQISMSVFNGIKVRIQSSFSPLDQIFTIESGTKRIGCKGSEQKEWVILSTRFSFLLFKKNLTGMIVKCFPICIPSQLVWYVVKGPFKDRGLIHKETVFFFFFPLLLPFPFWGGFL